MAAAAGGGGGGGGGKPKKLTLADVLLPKTVVPTRYDLHLVPDLKALTFTGTVAISVTVAVATTTIKLHANKLGITGVPSYAAAGGSGSVAAVGVALDFPTETATITFPSALPPGTGTLSLAFAGVLNDDLVGFYRSRYTVRGESRNMAVTQFEATDARRAFPCFDEPALKAVFGVKVTAPADRTVISNSTAVRVDTAADGASRTWLFADTPRMSSYLVAVVVGEFDAVSARGPVDGVVTTVYTPVGKAALGGFALKVGVDALAYLAHLFSIPYMGTKVDHIAIPDFAAGAMENLGAITYREAALLIDEAESSLATKQRVAQVVAHELSHQWFGDYTTMAWWSGLFLNEGFAKHMEYVVTDKLFPEWNTFSHFTSQVQASAFRLDAMATTHPIEVAVAHPDEVNEIFDLISYNKSASVLRMLFNWLRQDVAFRGLHTYMTRHAYGNAVTEDLWAALAEESGQPVAAVMKCWTAMPGYPYLAVSTTDRSGGALHRHSLRMESRRFIAPWALDDTAWPADSDFADGPSPASFAAMADKLRLPPPAAIDPKVGNTHNNDWCMPVTVMMGAGAGSATEVKLGVLALDAGADAPGAATPRDAKLAGMAEELATAASAAHARWFKVNADHANFYRTVYDSALLARLHDAVRSPADRASAPPLGTNDRIGLVGDVAAAVSVGLSSAADLLTLLWTMRHESDYNVWCAMLDALADVSSAAETVSAAAAAAVDAFTRVLLAPALAWLGWEAVPGEAPNTPLLRAMLLRSACIAGDAATRDAALARFDAYAAGGRAIPADLRQVVYNTAASHGGAGRWEALYRLFKAATMSEEQRRLMSALGRATEPALLARALDMIMTDEVRVQDAVFVFASVASTPGEAGRALAWDFVRTQWDAAFKRFGTANFLWASMLGAATQGFDTRERADEVAAFFATHPAGSGERKVAQSLEGIRTRVWRAAILARDPTSILSCIESLLATA